MNPKLTRLATLFAAGAFAASGAPTLGARPIHDSGRPEAVSMDASGACGGKEMKDDKKPEEGTKGDVKKDMKKGEKKEGSCGAGSCGAKKKDMKKGGKKDGEMKEGSCGAKKKDMKKDAKKDEAKEGSSDPKK